MPPRLRSGQTHVREAVTNPSAAPKAERPRLAKLAVFDPILRNYFDAGLVTKISWAPDDHASAPTAKRIFAAIRSLDAGALQAEARKVADELASDHVAAQITRMQASITSDPALAIGSAKEFVESICKGILKARGLEATGKEDLPKLVHLVRMQLGMVIDKRTETTLRGTLGALASLTHGIAELRGQLGTGHGANPDVGRPPVEVARLAVVARRISLGRASGHCFGLGAAYCDG
jgi:hypothetical protein